MASQSKPSPHVLVEGVLVALLSTACALFIPGCRPQSPDSGTPDESPEPRLLEVTVYHTDSQGKDHQLTLSEKERETFCKLYPATPDYRDDGGIKCADAVGITMKYSDGTASHAHFCGKPTQLHISRQGHKSEMLTVEKGLYTLFLDAARARGWQLDTLGNWSP